MPLWSLLANNLHLAVTRENILCRYSRRESLATALMLFFQVKRFLTLELQYTCTKISLLALNLLLAFEKLSSELLSHLQGHCLLCLVLILAITCRLPLIALLLACCFRQGIYVSLLTIKCRSWLLIRPLWLLYIWDIRRWVINRIEWMLIFFGDIFVIVPVLKICLSFAFWFFRLLNCFLPNKFTHWSWSLLDFLAALSLARILLLGRALCHHGRGLIVLVWATFSFWLRNVAVICVSLILTRVCSTIILATTLIFATLVLSGGCVFARLILRWLIGRLRRVLVTRVLVGLGLSTHSCVLWAFIIPWGRCILVIFVLCLVWWTVCTLIIAVVSSSILATLALITTRASLIWVTCCCWRCWSLTVHLKQEAVHGLDFIVDLLLVLVSFALSLTLLWLSLWATSVRVFSFRSSRSLRIAACCFSCALTSFRFFLLLTTSLTIVIICLCRSSLLAFAFFRGSIIFFLKLDLLVASFAVLECLYTLKFTAFSTIFFLRSTWTIDQPNLTLLDIVAIIDLRCWRLTLILLKWIYRRLLQNLLFNLATFNETLALLLPILYWLLLALALCL